MGPAHGLSCSSFLSGRPVPGHEVAGPRPDVEPAQTCRGHPDLNPPEGASTGGRAGREAKGGLFPEIASHLRGRRDESSGTGKVRDAPRVPAEPFEQSRVFLFLGRRRAHEPDGVDDRVGLARERQNLGVRLPAGVVAAVADDDQRAFSASVRAGDAAGLRQRHRTAPFGLRRESRTARPGSRWRRS